MSDSPVLRVWKLDPRDPRVRTVVEAGEHSAGQLFAITSESQDSTLGAELVELVGKLGEALHEVQLGWCSREAVAALGHASGLKRVSLGFGVGLDDDDLTPLAALPDLRSLRIEGWPELRGSFVKHFAGAPLQSLRVKGTARITGKQLAGVERLASLTVLHVDGASRLGDDVFARLAQTPSLERLWLTSCKRLTDAGVLALAKAPSLVSVNLWNCPGITRSAVDALASQRGLRFARAGDGAILRPRHADVSPLDRPGVLRVARAEAENATLRDLACEADLDDLSVRDVPSVTDDGIDALRAFDALRGVTLVGLPGVRGAAVARLVDAHHPTLQRAALGPGVALDDAALQSLGAVAGMRHLMLHGLDSVSDDGLRALARCRDLELLEVSDAPRVSSDAIASLAPLPALFTLTLRGLPALDDRALGAVIAGAPTLTELRISDAPRLRLGGDLLGDAHSTLIRLHLSRCPALSLGFLSRVQPQLSELRLVDCPTVEGASLDALIAFPSLKNLWLWGCPKVTTGALVRLIARGSLQVVWIGDAAQVDLDAVEVAVTDARSVRGRMNLERLRDRPV